MRLICTDKYVISVDGTFYPADTAKSVIFALENARRYKHRVWLRFGDPETGFDDLRPENGAIGYVGRSSGHEKVVLLLKRENSLGGDPLPANRIVRIKMDFPVGRYAMRLGRCRWGLAELVYEHPSYHYPTIDVAHVYSAAARKHVYEIRVGGELLNRYAHLLSVQKWLRKMSVYSEEETVRKGLLSLPFG